MARGGGRGGGRGGRGGGGGGGGTRVVSKAPWSMDPSIEFDPNPSKVFPEYTPPVAAPLRPKEEKHISYFLLFREQLHDGPLYTHARTRKQDPQEPTRFYGQEQINDRYGTTNKATVDPFLAVTSYSQRFQRSERSLPDLASRPFAKRFFPAELHSTLEGTAKGANQPNKRRKTTKALTLSSITALRTAEDVFLPEAEGKDDGEGFNKMMEIMDKMEKNNANGEEDDGFISGEDDEDWIRNPDEDGDVEAEDQYDDEDDNDYNAEQYFDDGADEDDDDGGDDDGGTY